MAAKSRSDVSVPMASSAAFIGVKSGAGCSSQKIFVLSIGLPPRDASQRRTRPVAPSRYAVTLTSGEDAATTKGLTVPSISSKPMVAPPTIAQLLRARRAG
jgi:hypothetical protein